MGVDEMWRAKEKETLAHPSPNLIKLPKNSLEYKQSQEEKHRNAKIIPLLNTYTKLAQYKPYIAQYKYPLSFTMTN